MQKIQRRVLRLSGTVEALDSRKPSSCILGQSDPPSPPNKVGSLCGRRSNGSSVRDWEKWNRGLCKARAPCIIKITSRGNWGLTPLGTFWGMYRVYLWIIYLGGLGRSSYTLLVEVCSPEDDNSQHTFLYWACVLSRTLLVPMLSKDKNLTIFSLSIICFLIHLCSKNTGINELELFLSVQFSSIKYIYSHCCTIITVICPQKFFTIPNCSSAHIKSNSQCW